MIDADTLVIRAAMSGQLNYSVYQDNKFLYPTKSKLQWTKDFPKENPDEYEFRKEATLKKGNRGALIAKCKVAIKNSIKDIENKYPDRKSWICIEGEGNYREDIYPDYKGQRDGQILLRDELCDWVKERFPRVIIAEGCETDDRCARYMWEGYQDFLKTGEYTYMVASCDKDLRTVAGLLYNYCKDEEVEISELEADRWFCTQLLYGDSIDNIKGINSPISCELLKSYGVKPNKKGVGEVTAKNLMATATTSKECFEIVMECYKDAHKDKWLWAMKLEAIALRMQHTKDERYNIQKHMEHLGINLGDNYGS